MWGIPWIITRVFLRDWNCLWPGESFCLRHILCFLAAPRFYYSVIFHCLIVFFAWRLSIIDCSIRKESSSVDNRERLRIADGSFLESILRASNRDVQIGGDRM